MARYFVGLDVHWNLTTVCILNGDGKRVKRLTLRGAWSEITEEIQRLRGHVSAWDFVFDKTTAGIQTAMGWINSHLHQFDIKGQRYGDPELLDDGFEDSECVDSTITMLSDILPQTDKRLAFRYEYDFGDGWEHELLYEGSPPWEKCRKYPLCLEGERACPPEDVGGVWGYAEYLEALADPEHECHDEFMGWRGPFDPDDFDPKQATRNMKKGLPNWRRD